MLLIEKIENIMQEKGLKNSDLAEKLGINRSVVTNWINRKTDPPARYIVLICEFLNVEVEYLLEVESKTKTNDSYTSLITKFEQLTPKNKERIYGMLDIKIYEQELENKQQETKNNNVTKFPQKKNTYSYNYDNSNENTLVSESENSYGTNSDTIPVVGWSAAGAFMSMSEDELYYDMRIPARHKKAKYALKIKGDSMEPLIQKGSFVEVEPTPFVENGDIAIVVYNDEITCKKFYRDYETNQIRLVSLNKKYIDVYLNLSEEEVEYDAFRIIGKVLI